MIKLCVGCESIEQLAAFRKSNPARAHRVHTRMTPKRADELMNGGSLYWVMKGVIRCRQPIADILTRGSGKEARCEIVLEPVVVATAPVNRKAFQGWRYLALKDCPQDLESWAAGDLPPGVAEELRAIGAW